MLLFTTGHSVIKYVMWEHLSSPNQAKKINWLPSKAALLIALEGSKLLI